MRLKILETLQKAFPGATIEVIDESHLHEGHSGNIMNGESHFRVIINCNTLNADPLIKRHRRVHEALKDIMPRIHALSISFR